MLCAPYAVVLIKLKGGCGKHVARVTGMKSVLKL